MKDCVITGNWKMNKTIEESCIFIHQLSPLLQNTSAQVLLAIPFTALYPVSRIAQNTSLQIGAQNVSQESEGPFTGEISANMIRDAGGTFVLIGHSERRTLFHESDDSINKKMKQALKNGLSAILCIGESLTEKEHHQTNLILKKQLLSGLAGLKSEELLKVMIAYEPIWAIGTGHSATPESAEEVHEFCRSVVHNEWGEAIAKDIIIQYGGSVKPDNAKELLEKPNIDGLLVGGAALSFEAFGKIIMCSQNTKIRI